MKTRALILSIALAGRSALAQAPSATLIVNARVLDGTGAPARAVDVRIADGRITAVGRLTRDARDRIVDAHGLTLAPGFIDTHSHHDEGLLEHRGALAAVSQGVTTIVVGQDGESHFPLASWFARLDSMPAAINIASYIGHGTIRSHVMGDDYQRVATDSEVDRMRQLVREEMSAGALGLSTGLEYDPGIFSSRSEVLELAKVAGALGGRYISHMRSEDRHFWDALDELLTIGRVAHMPVQISHTKLAMRALWGEGDSLIATLGRARAQGIQVTADVYPYTMWASTLTVLYPERNFADRAETQFILKQVAAPEDLVIGEYALHPEYVGKDVGQIAKMRNTDPATTLMALIADARAKQAAEGVVARGMDERDIASIMRWPYTDFCSDGDLGGAHPRSFGSFPRVLGHYVRDLRVLTLEDAVRKMTSLAARNVGLSDRGAIRPGLAADLVLFDPKTVADNATMKNPHALSTGIERVWVNGEVVYESGKATGRYPGRVLRRADTSAVDRFVLGELKRQDIPGVAVGIVDHGKVTTRGYGFANLEHMVPVTGETIFESGSLGKMFTATAVMLQVEDGKLGLSDTITKFFPDAPASWRRITVRNLLNHTSGIPDYTISSFDYRKDYTEDELAHIAMQLTPEFKPGSRWNYSNTGYVLLGIIVHKVSGQFYGDVLKQRVFEPLGMRTARIIDEQAIIPNRAAGYQHVNGKLANQDWVAPKLNTTADGSLYWSVRDLVAWDTAVMRRKILKPESWKEILTPVRLTSGKTYPYGMGWALEERGGKPLQEHGGSWQGFKTQLSRFIGDSLDIIVLANAAEADPSRIADGIAAIIHPELAVRTPTPIADREPQTTQRVSQLLNTIREGRLTPAEFAYVRAGFFPDAANYYQKQLQSLGVQRQLVLLDRRELGDDRVYTYEVTFANGVRLLRVALAPDDKISSFSLRERAQ